MVLLLGGSPVLIVAVAQPSGPIFGALQREAKGKLDVVPHGASPRRGVAPFISPLV